MTNVALPRLIIVAGPNGAGKSSFSKNFSNANPIIFDPDKESQRIREKYHGLPDESIYYHIQPTLQDTMELAWKAQRDFILETQFQGLPADGNRRTVPYTRLPDRPDLPIASS